MAKLTYADLVEQGLELTKEEAQKLQTGITHISKFGGDGVNDVFNYDAPKAVPTENTGGLSGVKATAGFEPNAAGKKPTKKETAAQIKAREENEAAEVKRKAALAEAGLVERAVTQEDLDDNPELVEQNLKVGDTYQFPIESE